MGTLEELFETGLGALVLSFGVVAGVSVYWTGSLDGLSAVGWRFARAVALTFLPPLSSAAWPNVLAALTGVGVVATLEESYTLRAAGFVAAYVAVAVLVHYLLVPA